ncbi:MAG: flagellar motor switch protein FliG [endosymbiont of Galathealinum brachiosum]|uniref:Flagellar motor switch protein FliG n=1 Tax=endosymbiont of Galathealinum brachiosum TaxID=2200906 RepID=A0A370DJJ9_9GAMM|nr:MAG: flagellar motor switch protein FliG [endosymbiont of Galathealinum brachiosum]
MAEETNLSLNGVQRAAVLLMAMGSENAAEVLKHLNPKEVQSLGAAMANLENVNKVTMGGVMDDFISEVSNQTSVGIGQEDYIREMMVNALGQDKANSMIDRILLGSGNKGLESLKWMDARSVAEVIRLEHPQIISIVLSYLEPDQSAEVLKMLPERARPDILMRVAALEGIPPAALQELDKIMEKQFSGTQNVSQNSMGGFKTAANILNFMESSIEGAIMDSIAEHDQDMQEGISELMFVFDNLNDVDDRGIQALLREVSTDSLTLALKGAEEGLKEKILKNMSKRAAEMLREDMEARGPVRLSEVEAAQKDIISTARRLAEEGDIVLGGSGAEEMV